MSKLLQQLSKHRQFIGKKLTCENRIICLESFEMCRRKSPKIYLGGGPMQGGYQEQCTCQCPCRGAQYGYAAAPSNYAYSGGGGCQAGYMHQHQQPTTFQPRCQAQGGFIGGGFGGCQHGYGCGMQ